MHKTKLCFLLLIVSWGIKCGTPGVPGVYASVKEALCFIDFATRCNHGTKYYGYYNYGEYCRDWLDDKIEELEAIRPGNIYSKRAKELQESCLLRR